MKKNYSLLYLMIAISTYSSLFSMEQPPDKPIVVSPSGPISDQPLAKNIDFLTMLYRYTGPMLYISPEEMFDAQGKPVDLKVLFKKYQIVSPDYWTDEEWAIVTEDLAKRTMQGIKPYYLKLNNLPELLKTAKSIIKSFLLKDDNELPILEKNSIKKTRLGRLFTYAKMQRVIEEDKLSHVRLPRKVLVIKDTKTGEYVPSNEAPKIIDDILEPYIEIEGRIQIAYSGDYELIIFANREKNYYVKLSQEARKDLEIICQKAPFDVGYDNIFADSNGDAVIIDTENKGEPSRNCIAKLERYF